MENHQARGGRAQSIVHYFGRLDLFRVVQDQERYLTSASFSGAIVSTLSALFITLLIVQETYLFFRGEIRSSMFVPSISVRQEPMEAVHLSVSFPDMPCHVVGLAIVDQHGNMLPDLMRPSHALKVRLTPGDHKKEIGAYTGHSEASEGCKMVSTIMIDKVPGHFLVGAIGGGGSMAGGKMSARHIIHEMWIGNTRLDKQHDGIAEDLVNPLRNREGMDHSDTMYKFYLQVVPTYFRNDRNGHVKKLGYQYTASVTKLHAPHMPMGLYFTHKHSTLAVEYRYHYESWSHFFVSLCAIIGGVFTVMSFISSGLEALGDTPTVAKAMHFIANYFAGRRKAAEVQHTSPYHSPLGNQQFSPHVPPQQFSPHAPPQQPQRFDASSSNYSQQPTPMSPYHPPPTATLPPQKLRAD